MINHQQFLLLSSLEQLQTLHAYGDLITECKKQGRVYRLYQLFNFYVQRSYKKNDGTFCIQISFQVDHFAMRPYLADLKVPVLVQ